MARRGQACSAHDQLLCFFASGLPTQGGPQCLRPRTIWLSKEKTRGRCGTRKGPAFLELASPPRLPTGTYNQAQKLKFAPRSICDMQAELSILAIVPLPERAGKCRPRSWSDNATWQRTVIARTDYPMDQYSCNDPSVISSYDMLLVYHHVSEQAAHKDPKAAIRLCTGIGLVSVGVE